MGKESESSLSLGSHAHLQFGEPVQFTFRNSEDKFELFTD